MMTSWDKYMKVCTLLGVVCIIAGKGMDFMSITGAILIFISLALGLFRSRRLKNQNIR